VTALVAVAVVATAGCTSSGNDGARSSGAVTATTMAHHNMAGPAAVPANASPQEVQTRFEQLLGQHAVLAVRLTRNEVAKADDQRAATESALAANTDALHQLVGVAYGDASADRFKQLWQSYAGELAAYANGVASGNTAGAQEARAALLAYCKDWGAWLAQASSGRVDAGAAERAATARIDQLTRQVDAYATKDYEQAYKLQRSAYERTYGTGATLAKGSVSAKEAAGLDAAPEQMRSAFAMLLGEHMELIVEAQRATFAGAEEFDAAADQLNANTATMAKAMGGIVGPQKAAEFQTAWANHVEGLMAYTAAVAGNDEAGKMVAKENLDGFAERLALFFSDVVRNLLATDPLTDAITSHDSHLINHVDAFAAKDYARAHQVEDEGYQQMAGIATVLVDAIQKVMQSQQPAGGMKTGGGGTAHRHR
jgi:hypothetical protein